MTCLGTVTLRREDGHHILAEVLLEDYGDPLTPSFTIKDCSKDEKIGFLSCISSPRTMVIEQLTNYTHGDGQDKVHMGDLVSECVLAAFFRAGTTVLEVKSTGSYWYYMSRGFAPVDSPAMRNCWRMLRAEEFYKAFVDEMPLSVADREYYDKQRALLAEGLGVDPKALSFERVCKSPNLVEEMQTIYQRAVAQKKHAPPLRYPTILMRMAKEGIERGKVAVMTSELQHDARNILQEEVLVNFFPRIEAERLTGYVEASSLAKIADQIAAYAG